MIQGSALETARLIVRPFEDGDVDRLVEVFADPQVHRFVDDGQPLPRENAVQWVVNSRANLAKFGFGTGAVIERASGRLIGWAGLARPPGDEPEIIYGFESAAWRKGYGRELLAALVEYCRAQGVRPVRATVAADNTASAALLRDFGFRRESWDGEPEDLLFVID